MFKQLVESQRGFSKTVYIMAGCVGALLLAPYLGLLHWSAELSSISDAPDNASQRRTIVRQPIENAETDEPSEFDSTLRSGKRALHTTEEDIESLDTDPAIEDIEELLGR